MDVLPERPGSTPVRIAQSVVAQIQAATVAALPQEACGLLFGSDGEIRAASIAANIARTPVDSFEIDPAHLLAAQRGARERGPALVGCWHSHPNGRMLPSRRDAAGVTDQRWLWLIATTGGIALFQPESGGFRRIALQIMPVGAVAPPVIER